jgi:predicted transcriptional regulator
VTARKKAPIPRPARRAPIDLKVVEGMAGVGATNCEIAEFLGIAESTVRKHCAPLLEKTRAGLKTRLRQAQLKAALGGNPAMLIWLGKAMLGQKETQVVETRELPQIVIE